MTPVKFPESNVTFAKDQPEYKPLVGYLNPSDKGEFIFCMKLTLWERVKILFKGHLWVQLLTFNKPLTPSFFSVDKKDMFTNPL